MERNKRLFVRQKPRLYFDENFPLPVVNSLKANRKVCNYFRLYSVYDFHHQNKDDRFQYEFAKKKKFTLVTLDKDFMNDRRFPINKMAGIIVIAASHTETTRIVDSLLVLMSFLVLFPFPKYFMGDTKFQVSPQGCIVRGRDAKTREIKTITIFPGDTMSTVAGKFGYWG
jgi:hypothetical protein